MSILSDFLALVDPLFDGRAYRNKVPEKTPTPYAKFFRVSGIEGLTLDDNGGDDNETNTRIQIDIYGSAPDVDARAGAVRAALKTWHVSNVILIDMDGYEDDMDLHRVTFDISTWHQ